MVLAVANETYYVDFKYVTENDYKHPVVKCTIRWQNPKHSALYEVSGYAFCHPNDRYEKEIGRKVAFKQAVDALVRDLDGSNYMLKSVRELRREFWFAFNKVRGKESYILRSVFS